MSANPEIDQYLDRGCGRCPLYNTPACKVNSWREELKSLRAIVLKSGLKEELKWGVPCYTFEGDNVLIISALKEYCTISFFKGVLLKDPENLLDKPGPNTQSARLIRYTSTEVIEEQEEVLLSYIQAAIEIEKAGLKVDFKAKNELAYPEELEAFFERDPALQNAFEALTPGRQRGYVLYFSAPKQAKTRISRIEKYIPRIFEGKGVHDR